MIDLHDPQERAAAAGEYVLGTLDAQDHLAVRAALASDPALASEVYAWQDRLLALTARAAAVEPEASVWFRIERSIEGRPRVAPSPVRERASPAWWQRIGVWQGIAAAALAFSVVVGVRSLYPASDTSAARYLAVLQSPEDKSTGWVVELDESRGLRLVPVLGGNAVPAGRALQFWTKAEGAAGPTSLGLVRPGQTVELPVSRLPAVGARQLFEITLEPENGSPVGRPTGPILYVGQTVKL